MGKNKKSSNSKSSETKYADDIKKSIKDLRSLKKSRYKSTDIDEKTSPVSAINNKSTLFDREEESSNQTPIGDMETLNYKLEAMECRMTADSVKYISNIKEKLLDEV